MLITEQIQIQPGNVVRDINEVRYRVIGWEAIFQAWHVAPIDENGDVIDDEKPVDRTITQADMIRLNYRIKQ